MFLHYNVKVISYCLKKVGTESLMNKNNIFYILVTGVFGILIWLVLQHGYVPSADGLPIDQLPTKPLENQSLSEDLLHRFQHPFAIFLLQIITVIIFARLFGWLAIKIRQPTVIGEIIAGIVLGPSLIGLLFPNVFAFIFPPSSISNLHFLSQVGLILFMFIVGMELDMQILKRQSKAAVIISHSSIIFSYFLGVLLACFLYDEFAPKNVAFSSFALFMGITMSITAFPVLARIIQERGLAKTNLGITVITCAAIDDITAWCLLAVVIAFVKAGGIAGGLITILLVVLYLLFMLFAARPILNRLANRYFTRETVNKPVVAFIFAILLFSAYLTELIGIHALIGAFVAGVIIPNNLEFRQVITEKIEDVSLVLLMPLFFAYTGLRTQIGLLNNQHLWILSFLIICVAVTGKFFGSSLAARFLGKPWKDSLLIGALMNTRGLMELVVLNIGLDLGVLSPAIFTMLVLMALVTTFMTGPAIDLITYLFTKKPTAEELAKLQNCYRILIPFGIPQAGGRLLQLADQLTIKDDKATEVTALHLTSGADVSIQEAKVFEVEGFVPILNTAKELGVEIKTQYKVSDNISREIVNFANAGRYNLMFVGSSRSMFSKNETGGRAKYFFDDAKCTVGVLVDRGFQQINQMMIVIDKPSDAFLLTIGTQFIKRPETQITVWDQLNNLNSNETLSGLLTAENKTQITKVEDKLIENAFLDKHELIVVSLEYWNKLKKQQAEWINYSPSILIVNKEKDPMTDSSRLKRFARKNK